MVFVKASEEVKSSESTFGNPAPFDRHKPLLGRRTRRDAYLYAQHISCYPIHECMLVGSIREYLLQAVHIALQRGHYSLRGLAIGLVR